MIKKKKLNRISEALEAKDKSQYWLAKATGITYMTITSYVHGKTEPTLNSLFDIADALEINPKDLINA